MDETACQVWDVTCWVGDLAASATQDAFEKFVYRILEGLGKAMASLGTLWVQVPSPVTAIDTSGASVSGGVPPESQAFVTILGWVFWVSLGIAVASLMVAGAMMVARRRLGDGETHMSRVGVILFAVVLISSASALISGILPAAAPAGGSSAAGFIQNELWWYTGGIAVLSVLIGGARMVWTQRAQPVRELLQSLVTLIAVSGAGLTGIALAVSAADAFSVWILNNATDCDVSDPNLNCFGRNVYSILAFTQGTTAGIGLIAVFCLGLLALLMTYAQLAMMIIRGGMLVVLAGILPMTAAITNTELGRNWFRRSMGWTIAFILYKPAAAIVYATAFRLGGTRAFAADGTGLAQIITGMALMLVALIALPALMRFAVPAVAAISSGGSSGGLMLASSGVAAAGAIATGAIQSSSPGGAGGQGGAGAQGRDATGSAGTAQTTSAVPAGLDTAATGGAKATAGAGAGSSAGAAGGAAAGAGVGAAVTVVAEGAKRVGGAAKSVADEATGSDKHA